MIQLLFCKDTCFLIKFSIFISQSIEKTYILTIFVHFRLYFANKRCHLLFKVQYKRLI